MAVALAGHVRLHDHAVRLGERDVQLLLHAAEQEGTTDFVVGVTQVRIPVGIELLVKVVA